MDTNVQRQSGYDRKISDVVHFIIKFKFHENLIHLLGLSDEQKDQALEIKTRSRNRKVLLFDKNLNIQMIHFQLSTRNFRCVILNDHH